MIIALIAVALAQVPADAPVADAAPDVPGLSVRLHKGDVAPFDGRELSNSENLRRGKSGAECQAELADAKANGVLLPRAGVAALISGGAAAVIGVIVLGLALAAKKGPGP